MKLKELLCDCNDDCSEIEIKSLCFNSEKATEGSLYFCIDGTKTDGHLYAKAAVANGAAALVVQRILELDTPQILVENARRALSLASSKFFGEPSKKMKMIAVTGTNGKTTTTYIIKSILEAAQKKVGIIGTTAVIFGNTKYDSHLTTPDPIELHGYLSEMLKANVEYVVMEASAHALELNKLDGIIFDVAAFTNLSQDHLDFFENMTRYMNAKKKLFSKEHSRFAVINVDDAEGRHLLSDIKIPQISYGCYNPADVFAINLNMSVDGLSYILNLQDDIAEVKFNLPGKFNMYNTLCAAAVASALKIELKDIITGLRQIKKIEGRFNIINSSKCSIIIDFAHTDDGLRNILSTIKEFAPKKIITVFGCGGDRDKTKRPAMGKVVTELSDFTIITSDNPRSENPNDIINDISMGVDKQYLSDVLLEPNRKIAIIKAIEYASSGDIILVAGKGAEKYQEIMGVKQAYNDEEYIMQLIEEKKI